MRSVKTDIVFFLVTAIALTLLTYLVYNALGRIDNSRHFIKVFSTLALPVPLSFFMIFITAARPRIIKEATTKDIIIAALLFVVMIAVTFLLISQYNHFSRVRFQDRKLLPVLVNTLLTFAYINNYLTTKNVYWSGVLSGLLLGLALFIFNS